MFDIISFIREKIFRRPKLATPLAWEELSEKQTTKLGYFLLYCMFAAILSSAQWTLSEIKGIPDRPTPVPYCVTNLVNAFDNNRDDYGYYYDYSYNYNDCILTSKNPEFDFTKEYNNLLAPYNEIISYNDSIKSLESKKGQLEYNQSNSQKDYNTSLNEKIADEKSGLYETQDI
ncbi:MAG: hypothetical protein ACD_4C00270G0001, partial [uncultured bacterium (gcode 4)]